MKSVINERWPINLPHDRLVFHRDHADWEKARLSSMFDNIKKGDVVIDVGAEVGDYAALFATWGAKVVCIEPQPKYWPIIKNHFDLNKLTPLRCFAGFANNTTDIEPARADFALGYKDGWPLCAFDEAEDWHGFRNAVETGISTPQTRLDDFVLGLSPDIITIDVEGAELEVLKGADAILKTAKPIVYISIHPDMMRHDYSQTPQDIFNYLEGELGYEKKFIERDHEEHWVFWHPSRRVAV